MPTWYDAPLKTFFIAKAKQARQLAKEEEKEPAPEVWPYFEAGMKGNWITVTDLWTTMRNHFQAGKEFDERLNSVVWPITQETEMASREFANWEEKYAQLYSEEIIKSIPRGSVYFGGTDPGRSLITVMSKSHADADPFFTLTQNALADGLYLKYVRSMYGKALRLPTDEEVQESFQDYASDAVQRLQENTLKPGENVTKTEDGRIQIQGQTAVMELNARLVRRIFEKNEDRNFYIEESVPLD